MNLFKLHTNPKELTYGDTPLGYLVDIPIQAIKDVLDTIPEGEDALERFERRWDYKTPDPWDEMPDGIPLNFSKVLTAVALAKPELMDTVKSYMEGDLNGMDIIYGLQMGAELPDRWPEVEKAWTEHKREFYRDLHGAAKTYANAHGIEEKDFANKYPPTHGFY